MESRRRNLAIGALLVVVAISGLLAWSRSDSYRRAMRPVYAVIAAEEQGWGDEATKLLEVIVARSPDRHALAEQLMRESDGSLVAEGMVLAVRSHHPQAESLVKQHLSDRRWNWALANNDELAQQLLLELEGKPVENWVALWLGRAAASEPNVQWTGPALSVLVN